MVGLSIVLETTNNLNDGVTSPKPHQVINKTAVIVTTIASSASDTTGLRRGSLCPGFLEHCFLCKRKLLPAKDIYMYKGDRAFCSVECRSRQMIMDEEESLRNDNCPLMAVKKKKKSDSPRSPSGGHPRHRRDPRSRAGGFAY